MTSITFTVYGPPVGKSRARVTSRGTYTPAKTRNYQAQVATEAMAAAAEYRRQTGQQWPIGERYRLHVTAVYPNKRHPDGDNILKAVSDAMNRVMYADDRQVHRGGFDLLLGEEHGEPRCEVVLEVLG